MATRQRWEYLTVQTGTFGIVNANQLAAQFLNGHEIKDWKKVPLHAFLAGLGADGWEMSGTFNSGLNNYLFFKRPIP